MNVTTIQMEQAEAEAKLAAYREALSRKHSKEVDEEWSAAANACKELAKGTPLVDPISAIRDAGWREDARPVLAIARADQRFVRFLIVRNSRRWDNAMHRYAGPACPMTWEFNARKGMGWDGQRMNNLKFQVENIIVEPPGGDLKGGTAMIPMVPPDVLPDRRGCDLRKHFILWEVEDWDAAPPIDPMLLKPIGGDLYAVVAQWNLTELERKIIAGTRR